ncbi:hypothetical protein D9611_002416 [Ephemerocybe angulata]|uniref:Uncharacterized protein n=1 Tax=Ephemerocybe angulata TaxID=980116 RepID=A0A8H5FDM1_9AGAR|nr:hypothetical protein D9611_002416 [Tulosesus angulatus]
MSFSSSHSSYSLYPAASCGPNAFNLFAATSNPRDNHVMCGELGEVLRSSRAVNMPTRQASYQDYASHSSPSSLRSTKSSRSPIKRWFGIN